MVPVGPILIVAIRVLVSLSRSKDAGTVGRTGGQRPVLIPGLGPSDVVRLCLLAVFLVISLVAPSAVGGLPAEYASVAALPLLDALRALKVTLQLLGYGVLSGLGLTIAAVPSVSGPILARGLPPSLSWFALRLIAPYAARGQDAAWAALTLLDHARRPLSEPALARIEAGLAGDTLLLPLTLVARAAIADARGDDLRARDLFTAVHKLPAIPGHGLARRYARRWLVVRAATRGNWDGVDAISAAPFQDGAVRVVIQRLRALRGGIRPGRAQWIVGGLRWGQLRVERAVGALPPGPRPEYPSQPPPGTPPLARALWWQRYCCLAWPTLSDLRATGAAWDVLPQDAALLAAVTTRAQGLGARVLLEEAPPDPPEPAILFLSRLWQSAVHQLASLCVVRHVLPPDEGQTLRAVRRLVTDALHKELAEQLATLEDPAQAEVVGEPVAGWLRFQRVRAVADCLLQDADATERSMVFEQVCSPMLDFAVWLYNQRGQRVLGHCIMLWLLQIGAEVGSDSVMKTLSDNVALGC